MNMDIKYIFLVGFCSLGLAMTQTSCEDFLDKSPDMGLVESDVYKSYESIRGYMDRAYSFLDTYVSRDEMNNGRFHVCTFSDEMVAVSNGAAAIGTITSGNWLNKSITQFEIGNSTNTSIGRSYKSIRILNRVINDIDKVVNITEDQKTEILGQAYFLRAWFYFQLIKRYGGMPKLDKMIIGDGDDDLPRMTYHESHDWMMEDIEKAIVMLPDAWDEDNTGRANKIAAMAFKSMAQLYDASPLMQNGLEETKVMDYDMERAKTAAISAQAVLDYMETHTECGNYLMCTKGIESETYQHLFYWTAPPFTQPEYLWYNRKTSSNVSYTINSFWLTNQYSAKTGEDAVAVCAPTQNMVDLFEKKGDDGNYYPIDNSKSGYSINDPYKDRDPRFNNNILYCGQKWGATKTDEPLYITTYEGGGMSNYWKESQYTNKKTQTGYLCKKFWWEGADLLKNQLTLYRFITVYIRVAQIYLDFAEASFEATGSATEVIPGCKMSAVDALNVVRRRAGITDLTKDIYNNSDEFRKAYRRERAVELMFEFHRWFDLRRWMTAHEVLGPVNRIVATPKQSNHASISDKTQLTFTYKVQEIPGERRVFEMRNYWYPFSMEDVASMKNLKQNPGW